MNYVIPIIINNRRYHYLDLYPDDIHFDSARSVGSETFIVELPQGPLNEVQLFSVDLSRMLQTLIEQTKDIVLSDLKLEATYAIEKKELLVVFWTDTPNAEPLDKFYRTTEGFDINIKEKGKKLNISFKTKQIIDTAVTDDLLKVRIAFYDGGRNRFDGTFSIALAHFTGFISCGLDFGSESSQMRQNPINSANRVNAMLTEYEECEVFTWIKDACKCEGLDEDYLQYDSGDTTLYRSIFFVNKKIDGYKMDDYFLKVPQPGSNLNMMELDKAVNADFLRSRHLLPNLKLVHKHGKMLKEIKFVDEDGDTQSLENMKGPIYRTILREIIGIYLKRRIRNNLKTSRYVQFTLLVPNIYDINDVRESQKAIKEIIHDLNNKVFNDCIRAVDVITLSESDASFLGYYKTTAKLQEKDSFYIVVDCGKGTTDFSVIKSNGTTGEITPYYRNGFAGAGNMITYGFLESALHFLIMNAENPLNAQAYLRNFLTVAQTETVLGREMYRIVERWKHVYNPDRSKASIEQSWNNQKDGSFNLKNFFNNPANTLENDKFLGLLKKCTHCYDWGNHISEKVDRISEHVVFSLKRVVDNLDNSIPCGGILLTGRAFLFKPLQDKISRGLKEQRRLAAAKLERPTNDEKLKKICLDGVFRKNFIVNNDMVGFPIEVINKNVKTDADNGTKRWLGRIKDLFGELFDISGGYDNSTNSLEIKNPNLQSAQFMLGSSMFSVHHAGYLDTEEDVKGDLTFTRHGFFVRAKNSDDEVVAVMQLTKDEGTDEFELENIIPSLFPGKIELNRVEPLKVSVEEEFDKQFAPK